MALQVSRCLMLDPRVHSVHLTGGRATYDAIRATPGMEAKELTAELGNFTPHVVVPGPWTEEDCAYHAKSVAYTLMQVLAEPSDVLKTSCLAVVWVLAERNDDLEV